MKSIFTTLVTAAFLALTGAGASAKQQPNGAPNILWIAIEDDWVDANGERCDFDIARWPAWYPTRTLEGWAQARAQWEPWVFREPTEQMDRPSTVHGKKKKKPKSTKPKS